MLISEPAFQDFIDFESVPIYIIYMLLIGLFIFFDPCLIDGYIDIIQLTFLSLGLSTVHVMVKGISSRFHNLKIGWLKLFKVEFYCLILCPKLSVKSRVAIVS